MQEEGESSLVAVEGSGMLRSLLCMRDEPSLARLKQTVRAQRQQIEELEAKVRQRDEQLSSMQDELQQLHRRVNDVHDLIASRLGEPSAPPAETKAEAPQASLASRVAAAEAEVRARRAAMDAAVADALADARAEWEREARRGEARSVAWGEKQRELELLEAAIAKAQLHEATLLGLEALHAANLERAKAFLERARDERPWDNVSSQAELDAAEAVTVAERTLDAARAELAVVTEKISKREVQASGIRTEMEALRR